MSRVTDLIEEAFHAIALGTGPDAQRPELITLLSEDFDPRIAEQFADKALELVGHAYVTGLLFSPAGPLGARIFYENGIFTITTLCDNEPLMAFEAGPYPKLIANEKSFETVRSNISGIYDLTLNDPELLDPRLLERFLSVSQLIADGQSTPPHYYTGDCAWDPELMFLNAHTSSIKDEVFIFVRVGCLVDRKSVSYKPLHATLEGTLQ